MPPKNPKKPGNKAPSPRKPPIRKRTSSTLLKGTTAEPPEPPPSAQRVKLSQPRLETPVPGTPRLKLTVRRPPSEAGRNPRRRPSPSPSRQLDSQLDLDSGTSLGSHPGPPSQTPPQWRPDMGPPPPMFPSSSFSTQESFGESLRKQAGSALGFLTPSPTMSSRSFLQRRSFDNHEDEDEDKDEASERAAAAEAKSSEAEKLADEAETRRVGAERDTAVMETRLKAAEQRAQFLIGQVAEAEEARQKANKQAAEWAAAAEEARALETQRQLGTEPGTELGTEPGTESGTAPTTAPTTVDVEDEAETVPYQVRILSFWMKKTASICSETKSYEIDGLKPFSLRQTIKDYQTKATKYAIERGQPAYQVTVTATPFHEKLAGTKRWPHSMDDTSDWETIEGELKKFFKANKDELTVELLIQWAPTPTGEAVPLTYLSQPGTTTVPITGSGTGAGISSLISGSNGLVNRNNPTNRQLADLEVSNTANPAAASLQDLLKRWECHKSICEKRHCWVSEEGIHYELNGDDAALWWGKIKTDPTSD